MLQVPEAQRLQPAFAVGLHVVGEDRVHQQRHMAADVVEDVGLLQVIELVAAPNEAGRRKAAAREMGEEHIVRHEPGHRDDPPPGRGVENIAQAAEIGNPVGGDAEPAEPVEILAAGASDEQPLLPLEQQPPDRVLLLAVLVPVLLDRKIAIGSCRVSVIDLSELRRPPTRV